MTKHSDSLIEDCNTDKNKENPLEYFKLATLFFVLAIGMIFSSLIFLFELCHHHQQKNLHIRNFIICSRNPKLFVHQTTQTDYNAVQTINFHTKKVEIMEPEDEGSFEPDHLSSPYN